MERAQLLREVPQLQFIVRVVNIPVVSLQPTPARSAGLGKHSGDTHFPKDRSCETCRRTKITKAPCRKRTGAAVPRAENFGDLLTADHKVPSDNCSSICNRGARLGHSTVNENFTGNTKELVEVVGAETGSLKSFTLTFLGIRQSL